MKHVMAWMKKYITNDLEIEDQNQLSAKSWRKAYVAWTNDPELAPIAEKVMAHSKETRQSNYERPDRAGLAQMMSAIKKNVLDEDEEDSDESNDVEPEGDAAEESDVDDLEEPDKLPPAKPKTAKIPIKLTKSQKAVIVDALCREGKVPKSVDQR